MLIDVIIGVALLGVGAVMIIAAIIQIIRLTDKEPGDGE